MASCSEWKQEKEKHDVDNASMDHPGENNRLVDRWIVTDTLLFTACCHLVSAAVCSHLNGFLPQADHGEITDEHSDHLNMPTLDIKEGIFLMDYGLILIIENLTKRIET